ncbi:GlxA family transcriptional regulator [Streptomyces avicenniae]|uniref:GlxA family transcriptional regulator n=1 Tax=Streptomyces avicenniae TaxID=500153 RepID=UPI00069A1786|nr:helix-turn-helix domain-containing protein [Streptomyces avicenniae]
MGRHVVALAVTEGAPIFELAVPCEVFGLARPDLVDPWYELRMCGDGASVPVAAGLRADTPYPWAALADADTVLVPACSRTVQLDPPPALLAALRTAHERGRRIVSLCAGAYLLAAAGLLDGRDATTHWMNAPDLADRYPAVDVRAAALWTRSGPVFTSAGTGAAIDLCLHLVREDHGAAVANEVARRMVVPPHREGDQAQYARSAAPPPGRADELAPVLHWAQERLHEPLTVRAMARAAHLSERTFARRFRDRLGTTPLQWLLQQRVRHAQELLETTDAPVETIAHRCGFGTSANLRHHFTRTTSVSPQTYRQVFRSRVARPEA